MMQTFSHSKKVIFLFFILLGLTFRVIAFQGEVSNSLTINFSAVKISLKQALKELQEQSNYSVVYGGKEINDAQQVNFSSKQLKLKDALNEIEKQAPVEFIINNSQIIVKAKDLPESYLLKGVVKDAKTMENLAAASIYIYGSNKGVVTNGNGLFSIKLPPGSYKLGCRFIGYKSEIIVVDLYQDKEVEFLLQVKDHKISAVNVRGAYTELEVMEKGRTIETIDSKVINRLNTNDVNDALHGRINGVWNSKVSGAPGDHHKIRVRGISSIFGCADPLYVVDGAIIPIINFENLGIADLNSHDVEQITVLKDASSTALYGNLGSNGVILIDTKKGGGKSKFNFSIKQGIQNFSKRYPLMEAESFLETLARSDELIKTVFYSINPKSSPPKYELYPTYRDSLGSALKEKDYQDELFTRGYLSEYQLSAVGSIKTIDYYVSGNYYKHNGVIKNTNYNKYTLTSNFSKVVADKFSVRLLYKGSHQENKNTLDNYLGNNVIFKGINYEPAYAATPDSFLTKYNRLYFNDYSPSSFVLSNHRLSPDSLVYKNNKIKIDNAHSINLQGFYRINDHFLLREISSISIRQLKFVALNSNSYPFTQQFLESSEKYNYFNTQFDLVYQKKIKNQPLILSKIPLISLAS